jgi:hypothetical protein
VCGALPSLLRLDRAALIGMPKVVTLTFAVSHTPLVDAINRNSPSLLIYFNEGLY